jgi:hypothetical protein
MTERYVGTVILNQLLIVLTYYESNSYKRGEGSPSRILLVNTVYFQKIASKKGNEKVDGFAFSVVEPDDGEGFVENGVGYESLQIHCSLQKSNLTS